MPDPTEPRWRTKGKPAQHNVGEVCPRCQVMHTTAKGLPACVGHSRTDPNRACTQLPDEPLDVCYTHGAASPASQRIIADHAAEKQARKLAARWGVPIDKSPTEAVLEQVRVWAGIELFYRSQVEALTPDEMVWGVTKETEGDVVVSNGESASLDKAEGQVREAKPNVWIALHAEASTSLVKFAAEAIRAGIEERRVRLAESQGALVADVLRAVAGHLNLTAEQAETFARVVPIELRRLAA